MCELYEMYENILDFKIDFSYELNRKKALNNVTGSISRGKCVVLCGESGSGKSTLLKCLNHLIPEFYEGVFDGYISVNREEKYWRSRRDDFIGLSGSEKPIFYDGK